MCTFVSKLCMNILIGWNDDATGSVVTLQLQGLGFDPELELHTVQRFRCYHYVHMSSFQVLCFLPTS